eukprot:m.162353 g.162353  ORF g.162353 m.162353 type:complete len:62 (+) comp23871_c0_seq1:1498-1683(+)
MLCGDFGKASMERGENEAECVPSIYVLASEARASGVRKSWVGSPTNFCCVELKTPSHTSTL